MLKRDELSDPTSCINTALDDEFVFVLKGRDPASPGAIRHWADARVNLGKNRETDAQIVDARAMATRMDVTRSVIRDRVDAERLVERSRKAKAFIADLEAVCVQHGLSLSHEDTHGAFVVKNLDEVNLAWLREASTDVEIRLIDNKDDGIPF